MDLETYAQAFEQVEHDYEKAVSGFGLQFEHGESCPRTRRAATADSCGSHCENSDASLWQNWISPACLACRMGERTATFFVDLRCTRHCYFCFNPNQDHYEYFLSHTRDMTSELTDAHAHGAAFDFLAVTGGEPMLHRDAVLGFLHTARELYPGAHTRLYTSGDLLDEQGLDDLAEAGLSEIRLSVKPEDLDDNDIGNTDSDHLIYRTIRQAVQRIADVVIEIPVIPGSFEQMKRLLVRADGIGVRGFNLLEFCFPLCNADEFVKRGFMLRKHPFEHLYDYWYGGGVPVAGSESEALELMRFASARCPSLGVHYCSSDNKNTGQVYRQNLVFEQVPQLQRAYPWLEQDDGSNFLVQAKAFGDDVAAVRRWAEEKGVVHSTDPIIPSISLPLSTATSLQHDLPRVELGKSFNIFELRHDGSYYLREVDIEKIG